MRYYLILFFLISSLSAQSYSYNALLWQDDSGVSAQEYDQDEAKAYCESLELEGYYNWRLPSLEELFSLIDISKRSPAVVDGISTCAKDYYWSSTIFASDNYSYWSIDFTTGKTKVFSPGTSLFVRCVR
ncbi:MAG: DUF1566 domain-containing protein [Campylobacterota bacterium]|nr:DUF1566 domain-containing protein [Campylobacterota bacterium]